MYTALPDLSLNVRIFSSPSASPVRPMTKTASHPKLTLTNPVKLCSATSRCTESVSPGEYRFTMAASAFVLVNKDSRRVFVSQGKGGGGVDG
jgi:hypothetical protein